MTRMGWLSIVAFCVGGAALIAAMLARRGFLGKINGLQRSLEQAPKALTAPAASGACSGPQAWCF